MSAGGAALLLLALLVLASQRGQLLDTGPAEPVDLGDDGQETGQGGAGLEVAALLQEIDISGIWSGADMSNANSNTTAFLIMLRRSEGTAGPNGYRTLFGGALFNGWADHPRMAKQFKDRAGRVLWTSAAGAYQAMAVSPLPGGGSTRVNTWDRIKAKLSLPDFSPASQDAFAIGLIDECGALADVQSGRFEGAVSKVRKVWASLPGAGYAQHENSLATLQAAYAAAGGTFA